MTLTNYVAFENDSKLQQDITFILFLFGATKIKSIKCSLYQIALWSW